MRTRTLLSCAAIITGLAVAVQPAHADPPATGYTMVFNDDFNGSTVDTGRWNFRTDVKGASVQRPQNVTVAGGLMTLQLRREPVPVSGKDWSGGGLISKQPFRYGFYETRAKLAGVAGWHTSFWLMAGTGSTTFPPEQRTEVDGFEHDSVSTSTVHHGIHTWEGSGVSGPYHPGTTYNTGLDLRQWHVYGFDWSETSVKFYVDGALKYTAPYTPSQWTHDYTNIWLTSIGYPSAPAGESTAQFDYIRYWQKDFYLDNDGPAAYGYAETGAWADSTLTGWTYRSPTRYAACHAAGNTATWRPHLRAAGTYQVFAYKIAHSGSDPAARYDVVHNGATSTTVVNGTTGSSGWVSLGTYAFPRGTSGFVRLTSSGIGCARADAVKFVRTG